MRGELVAKNRRVRKDEEQREGDFSYVNSQRASKCHASLNSNISSEKLASTDNSVLGYRINVLIR